MSRPSFLLILKKIMDDFYNNRHKTLMGLSCKKITTTIIIFKP